MARTPSRKRPCRICKRWFLPDPRLKQRQKTCGQPACQREWHRKKCAEWYRKNPDYFRSNYLQKKIEAAECQKSEPALSIQSFRLESGLPQPLAQEVIGLRHLLIIEYQAQLMAQRCRRLRKDQIAIHSHAICPQSGSPFSRGDPIATSCKNLI